MTDTDHVFVVVRFDTDALSLPEPNEADFSFTVIEVFPDLASARREVDRLNTLNGQRGMRYTLQSAPWYPVGEHI